MFRVYYNYKNTYDIKEVGTFNTYREAVEYCEKRACKVINYKNVYEDYYGTYEIIELK